jgi:hypothetical protein
MAAAEKIVRLRPRRRQLLPEEVQAADDAARAAALAEEDFRASLRRRVAWQADAAARIRAGLPLGDARLQPTPDPAPELAPAPSAVPAVEPGSEVDAVAPPAPSAALRQWNIYVLERAVRQHTAADAAQAEEWPVYLYYLRDYADLAGFLPRCFDGVVTTTFAPLLQGLRRPAEQRGDRAEPEERGEGDADAAAAAPVAKKDRGRDRQRRRKA